MPQMLVTRPEPDAAETIGRLAALGIDGVAVPLMTRAVLHTSLPEPQGFAALALTSVNALRALEARKALASASDEHLAAKWPFRFGDRVIMNESRTRTFRGMFFNHLIHHRAQLGVYLRLNNIAVPGLYGPSADEPFPS